MKPKFRELTIVACPGGGYVLYDFRFPVSNQAGSVHPPIFAGDLIQCVEFIEDHIETKE